MKSGFSFSGKGIQYELEEATPLLIQAKSNMITVDIQNI